MPNGNGLELLDTVRKYYANVPVFFITGYDDLSAEDARRRGATALFNKPFDMRSFVSTIKSSLTAPVS
jgi:FixJ family two-component response regulator